MGGKSHGGSPLVCFLGLTQIALISQGFFVWWKISRMLSAGLLQMLTQIQQEDCLWEFVVICGRKIFTKNICVIREIRGSKTSHEFVFWGEVKGAPTFQPLSNLYQY